MDSTELGTISTTPTTPTPTTKKRPRTERDLKTTAEPTREPVSIWKVEKNGKYTNIEIDFRDQGRPEKRSQSFEVGDNKRQTSRKNFKDTLRKVAFKIKTVTNDDVSIAVKKSEKSKVKNSKEEELEVFTTSKTFNPFNQAPPHTQDDSDVSFNISSQSPHLLAMASPSAARGVPTARSLKKQSSRDCAECGHRYQEADDLTDPWVGCIAWSDDKKKKTTGKIPRCETWVHASCTGWFPQNEEEVGRMPEWYCKKHRERYMVPRTTSTKTKKRKSTTKSKKSSKKSRK